MAMARRGIAGFFVVKAKLRIQLCQFLWKVMKQVHASLVKDQ
jgi:hypothetical protein